MSAVERVRAALAGLVAVDRPEVWVALRDPDALLAEAAAVDARVAAGEDLPLAGQLLAVKNNVDVAGLATTAACPGFGAVAEHDAPAVARLRAAGAVVLGATNLDQFATGLVGTRSPFGAVRDARRPDRISGGSSSGSAVAVALGLVDLAIGTDTAGSGRVPAALQGLVGLKATVGVVPTDGVVPACRSFDCVTVLARDLPTAERAMGLMAGEAGEAGGPAGAGGARPWPSDVPLAAPSAPGVAVPRELPGLSPSWAEAFSAAVQRLRSSGARVVDVDLAPFLEAARLLYDGGLVAERHAAVGAFVEAHRDDVDPVVGGIIVAAGAVPASVYVADTARLQALRAEAMASLEGLDALLVPTAPRHPSLAEVAAAPVAVNAEMGTYTNFANLFDLCAVAGPAGTADDGPTGVAQFGVTVLARAFADAVAADVARRVVALPDPPPLAVPGTAAPLTGAGPWPVTAGARAVPLVVVGAHRRGQALVGELESRGAAWGGVVRTAPRYRLLGLRTQPPKPGLVRCEDGGASVTGERWWLSEAALGSFLAALPPPMLLGAVELDDGTWPVGFACDAAAAASGRDLTEHGDWLTALRAEALAGR